MPYSAANMMRTGVLIGFLCVFAIGLIFMIRDGQDKTRQAILEAARARETAESHAAEERQRTLLLLEVIKQNQTSVNSTVAMSTALASRDQRLASLEADVRQLTGRCPTTRPSRQ